jgi:hypothetical protein
MYLNYTYFLSRSRPWPFWAHGPFLGDRMVRRSYWGVGQKLQAWEFLDVFSHWEAPIYTVCLVCLSISNFNFHFVIHQLLVQSHPLTQFHCAAKCTEMEIEHPSGGIIYCPIEHPNIPGIWLVWKSQSLLILWSHPYCRALWQRVANELFNESWSYNHHYNSFINFIHAPSGSMFGHIWYFHTDNEWKWKYIKSWFWGSSHGSSHFLSLHIISYPIWLYHHKWYEWFTINGI